MLFRSRDAMSKCISGVILYDETIWQKAKDGTPLVKLIEQAGAIPGIKVDEGTQPLPNCPANSSRSARQARRAAGGLLQAGRAVREMACGDRYRPGHSEHDRDPCQRPCAGPLCGALPGRPDRADRRARGADGWRSRHRSLLRRHPARAQQGFPGIADPAGRAQRHDPEAEHGDLGQQCPKQASVEEVAEKTVRC